MILCIDICTTAEIQMGTTVYTEQWFNFYSISKSLQQRQDSCDLTGGLLSSV